MTTAPSALGPTRSTDFVKNPPSPAGGSIGQPNQLTTQSFIKILTTQMRNLNPMGENKDPMESALKIFEFESSVKAQQMHLLSTLAPMVGNPHLVVCGEDTQHNRFEGPLSELTIHDDSSASLTIGGQVHRVNKGLMSVKAAQTPESSSLNPHSGPQTAPNASSQSSPAEATHSPSSPNPEGPLRKRHRRSLNL